MNIQKLIAIFLLPLLSHGAFAQSGGEANEPSPEELDAAYTEADALRDAAKWSDVEIVQKEPDPLGEMTAGADLVIRATVTSQSNGHNAKNTPLTHTTFSISEVLKGDYAADEITITQEGGPSKTRPNRVVIMSHTKYFKVGDEELLFLSLDPDNALQELQVRINNRFGIQQGKVFDENGRGLIHSTADNAPGYSLALSKDRNPHPRFRDFQIGSHKFSKKFKEDNTGDDADFGGDTAIEESNPASRGHQRSMDVSAFSAAVSSRGRE
jgi:hypothetical protein